MQNHRTRLRTLLCSGLILAVLPNAAFAVEPGEVAARLKTMFEAQGSEVAWANMTGDGSAMMFSGVTVTMAGVDQSVPVGDVRLSGITEDGDTIVIGELALPNYALSNEGVDVAIEGISIKGLRLPAGMDPDDPMSLVTYYQSADMALLTVQMAGATLASVEQVHMEVTPPGEGTPLEYSGAAERFTVDLGKMDDPQAKAVTEAMGYQVLNGYLEIAGSWSPDDGRLTLDQYDISIDQAGTIGMTVDIGGYTPAFIKALRDLQLQMAETGGQDQSAQGMAMLGLMQQLTLHGAAIRFDDDTLTQKALAFIASQQGVKPEDIANQAKAMLPFALAQLNNPELTAAASAAVNTFLDNPGSLEIRIAPASPIPFALVAASAMTAPQSLPQQLGLKITANE